MADLKIHLEQLVNLTVKLTISNNIEDEYGIEPAAATVVVSGADGAAEEFKQNSQLY
jgi:large subunit ribosomal protein L7/L12